MAPKVQHAHRTIERVNLTVSFVDEDLFRRTVQWKRPINEKVDVVIQRLLERMQHVYDLYLQPASGARPWPRIYDHMVWAELSPTRILMPSGRKVYVIECTDTSGA